MDPCGDQRRLRLEVTTFLAVAALSQSGCAIFTHLEASRQRDHFSFTPSFAVEDEQFRRSLDNVGSVMVGGNHAELLENGDALFPAMEKDILEAKHSVNIETYIFKPDEVGRRFAAAMIEAVSRGAIGYTGGFAFEKRWLGNARDKTEWHESSVRVTGPVVAQMQAIFSKGTPRRSRKCSISWPFKPPGRAFTSKTPTSSPTSRSGPRSSRPLRAASTSR